MLAPICRGMISELDIETSEAGQNVSEAAEHPFATFQACLQEFFHTPAVCVVKKALLPGTLEAGLCHMQFYLGPAGDATLLEGPAVKSGQAPLHTNLAGGKLLSAGGAPAVSVVSVC